MIVRINQIDLAKAESEADWASQGLLGGIEADWPPGTQSYEILILEFDEQGAPLPGEFRQSQLRQIIPQALAALRQPGEQLILRLDGPLVRGELLGAFAHLTDPDQSGRFAVSEVQKLEPEPLEIFGSVRIEPSSARLAELCADADLGLDRSVRLRAFAVPPAYVNPLLDIVSTDDERWAEVIPHCGFMLGTCRGLRALQVTSSRYGPNEVKNRLMQRLLTAAHSGKT